MRERGKREEEDKCSQLRRSVQGHTREKGGELPPKKGKGHKRPRTHQEKRRVPSYDESIQGHPNKKEGKERKEKRERGKR